MHIRRGQLIAHRDLAWGHPLRDNDDDPGDQGGGADTPPAPATPPAPGKTFSQDEVDQILGHRVAEARRSRAKELLSELGVDKLDDAKALIQAKKDADKAAMTEAERLQAEAIEARSAAERERAELATARHSLAVERALQAAGAQGDLEKISRLVEVEVGADQAAITAAVEAARVAFEPLFKAPGARTPASSEPAGGGQPPRSAPGTDPLAAGADLAKRYMEGQRTF